MENQTNLELSWMRVGAICGLLGIAAYLAAAFAPLPDFLGYFAAFAFGPLVSIAFMGLYHGLASERKTPLIQIAAVFGIAGGITVLIMLTTQQAIFGVMKAKLAGTTDPAAVDAYRKVGDGLNAVHYGIDVAWDVLISTAVILFGLAMIKNRLFGKVFGGIGVVLGGLLLGFNLWHFPRPPATSGSIDWGPFVALWMLAAFIMLLRATFRMSKTRDEGHPSN